MDFVAQIALRPPRNPVGQEHEVLLSGWYVVFADIIVVPW